MPTRVCWLLLSVALALGCGLGAAQGAVAPSGDERSSFPPTPAVDSAAYGILDATDETLLAGQNTEDPRSIASLTKVMTALLVVENAKGDEKVRISSEAASIGEASLGLREGETYTVDQLMDAMLAYSANDATVALAEHVAGSQNAFVNDMNARAARMDLTSTTFTSVTGLDTTGDVNTSTVSDLLTLVQTAWKDRRIQEAAGLPKLQFELAGGRGTVPVDNRNRLLATMEGVDGVKTGHTDKAGWCLIAHYTDDAGNDLFSVVLGAPSEDSRDYDSRRLLEWAAALRVRPLVRAADDRVGSAQLPYSSRRVDLFVAQDLAPSLRIGELAEERLVVPESLNPPKQAGEEVGEVQILVDNKVVASSPIFLGADVPEPSLGERATYMASLVPDAFRSGLDATADVADDLGRQIGLRGNS